MRKLSIRHNFEVKCRKEIPVIVVIRPLRVIAVIRFVLKSEWGQLWMILSVFLLIKVVVFNKKMLIGTRHSGNDLFKYFYQLFNDDFYLLDASTAPKLYHDLVRGKI